MKYLSSITAYFFLPLLIFAQGTINVPVDIVYNAKTENYYLSNSVSGNGNILKLDNTGNVINVFFSGLHYPGGLCLVNDILYVGDNFGKWGENLPSYLVGIDVNTGEAVLNLLIDATSTYIDLMTSDSTGNIYIANSGSGGGDGRVHKFNIENQFLTDLVTQTTRPNGVSYDYINERIIFCESSPGLSFLKSISPNGGEVTNIFYMNQRINGVIMHKNGDFYITSWGPDDNFGDESVYKADHDFSGYTEISTGHNRPLGMCVGKDNYLVVCNWGEQSLSFIDLDLFGVDEDLFKNETFTLYPNPANGRVYLKLNHPEIQEVEVVIHNLMGKEVHREKIHRTDMLSEKTIDLQQLPAGTYIVNFYSGNNVSHEKLILY